MNISGHIMLEMHGFAWDRHIEVKQVDGIPTIYLLAMPSPTAIQI
jgi:hypothetical protein